MKDQTESSKFNNISPCPLGRSETREERGEENHHIHIIDRIY